MANSQVTLNTIKLLGLNVQKEQIPKPTPVVDVSPKRVLNVNGTLTNATSQNLIPTNASSTQDVYILGATLSMIKDATATSTLVGITYLDENGATQYLLRIPSITLTAHTASLSIALPYPVKIKRGTSVNITSSTNVANIVASAVVYYMIDETSQA